VPTIPIYEAFFTNNQPRGAFLGRMAYMLCIDATDCYRCLSQICCFFVFSFSLFLRFCAVC